MACISSSRSLQKGDESLCENYRPVCLLAVGYKVFASVLLARLKQAGAERRLWPTQFGFRSGSGTVDALLLARKIVSDAWSSKHGSAVLLALDWAKAFDSVAPGPLATSLRRFGTPEPFVDMVLAICKDRSFFARDGNVSTSLHTQHFGFCQGCPRSPLLFVILMTVLLTDAKAKLTDTLGVQLADNFITNELVYADDTLLIDVSGKVLQQYMECVGEMGCEYGLEFNWSKLEMLAVRSDEKILSIDGSEVASKSSIKYLGCLLSADGAIQSELSRRLGLAAADFKALCRVWAHASINRTRKLQIYKGCVESTLMYGLHTCWLNKSQRRRLDGFQARCLRRLLGILPSFLSHVPNKDVLSAAGTAPLSTTLLE